MQRLLRLQLLAAKWKKRMNDPQTPGIIYGPSKKQYNENISPEIQRENKAVYDIEVDYEALIDPAIEKQIREILESYAEEYREKEIVLYGEREDRYGDDESMPDFGNIALPTAKFYSKKEHKRVKLLYAIAELGDVREVPLLQGMLDQEDNESISILIKEIILGFLSERSLNETKEIEATEIGYPGENYVYNYLFQAIDSESQHLLLDEVHKIGGEEELNFLRTLIGHPNEGIREKARSFHNELEQKKLGPSREEDIGTKLVPTKPNGAHLIRKAWIRLIQRIGEQLNIMGTSLSIIKIDLPYFNISRNEQKKHKVVKSSDFWDRTVSAMEAENEILHIDFELDSSEIGDREAQEARNKTHWALRFQRVKRSVRPLWAKLGSVLKIQ